ncbi:MAG: hypothetical protein ACREJD_08115 [Phycisphaerales bacterium]
MKNSSLALVVLGLAAAAPSVSLADNFNFTYNGSGGISAFGTLDPAPV